MAGFIRVKIKILAAVLFAMALAGLAAAPAWAGWRLRFVMAAGPAGTGLLRPGGLYVDASAKRYYIADSGHGRLLSYDRDGKPLRAFDAGGQFKTPVAMVKDGAGRLLVLEKGRGSLTVVDLRARKLNPVRLRAASRLYPRRLRRRQDNCFVLDGRDGTVYRLGKDLETAAEYACHDCGAGFIDFTLPGREIWGLAAGRVYRFAADGASLPAIDLRPPPEFAAAFAVNGRGEIFVAERHAGHIKIYKKNGKLAYTILQRGQKSDQLRYPVQLEFDPWGRLCVVDEGNGRVSVFAQ